jgi:4-amino-4-deoxy-L-arabinose transferase-like glycosyltransferase
VIRTPGRGPAVLLLLPILTLAAALRAIGAGYGLPLPVLNPDEANIVPRAWELVHGGGLDPGWYDYPSLVFAVLAPSQVLADGPSYGAARVVAVAIGMAGVAATWRLGSHAYGRSAAVVGALAVAVATTHVAYSRMAVTDALLTLGCVVSLALLVERRLAWAGLAIGLATSAKYPGAVLLVPLVVAAWGRWRELGKAIALAIGAFVTTSPFVLINAGAAADDLRRVQELGRLGWLGFEDDPATPLAFGLRLWDALGPAVLLLVPVAVVLARRRSRADLILGSFVLAWSLQLAPLEAHFDRYVLPLVPVLAVAVGSVRLAAPAFAALLVVPLAWSFGDARGLRGRDARLEAHDWIAATVPPEQTIAADPSTLPLAGRSVLRLELPGPGRRFDGRRSLAVLRAEGVRWVLVSGDVTDRVLAHPDRYPREVAFYRALAREVPVAFAADGTEPGLAGPWVRVHRLS